MNESSNYQPVKGVFWMLVTGVLFVAVTALVKHNGTRIPAAESAFLRYALGLVFFIPMIGTLRKAHLTPRQHKLFWVRGLAHSGGVTLWFYAMARIPIADVTAMNYLSPIYVTIGAALFLGEKLAFRRILAVVAALVGALIILRPGFREVGAGHLGMLFAAVVFAVSYLIAKIMADETNPLVVVAMLSITVTVGLFPMAMMNWVAPTLGEVGILFAVAAIATAGHFTMSMAFAAAPVTVTQPVSFLQLVWAVTLGVLVFDEAFDPWVVVGGLVIISSIGFITLREAALKRKMRTPVVPATKF
ncbi:DMT family transporter [Lentibacter algarum]|uniref:DMT family transporter n=1 Tax=Lentibacter algarum TaxID=576131 RepID=UPI001C066694|nr:DMT family transporter [Lentibacter algarum]MBU2980747.1 DMT family transporter [Lentibacter algarum]